MAAAHPYSRRPPRTGRRWLPTLRLKLWRRCWRRIKRTWSRPRQRGRLQLCSSSTWPPPPHLRRRRRRPRCTACRRLQPARPSPWSRFPQRTGGRCWPPPRPRRSSRRPCRRDCTWWWSGRPSPWSRFPLHSWSTWSPRVCQCRAPAFSVGCRTWIPCAHSTTSAPSSCCTRTTHWEMAHFGHISSEGAWAAGGAGGGRLSPIRGRVGTSHAQGARREP